MTEGESDRQKNTKEGIEVVRENLTEKTKKWEKGKGKRT